MPYFSFSCDFYKANILTGFAHLLEEKEFLDLTLAVDGHLVRVHRNVMALASPYLKDILKKSPSDNLVIYLNNVNHNDLSFLLEYIYQGEVNVPQERLESFMQLAQSLHIAGIALSPSKEIQATAASKLQDSETNEQTQKNIRSVPVAINVDHDYEKNCYFEDLGITIDNGNSEMCENENDEVIMRETNDFPPNSIEENNYFPVITLDETCNNDEQQTNNNEHQENYSEQQSNNNEQSNDIPISVPSQVLEIAKEQDIPLNSIALVKDNEIPTDIHIIIPKPDNAELDKSEPFTVTVKPLSTMQETAESIPPEIGPDFQFDKESVEALKLISQYSVTERGSLQIIVSRFIYNSHHEACGGQKRRWRCIDYRKKKCPAYIDSLDDQIKLRKGVHNHAYHDDKIYKKHTENKIFHSLKQADTVRKMPSTWAVDPYDEENI